MISLTATAQHKIGEFVAEAGPECRGVRIRAARVGSYTFRYQIHLVREADTANPRLRVAPAPNLALSYTAALWHSGAMSPHPRLPSALLHGLPQALAETVLVFL